MSINNIFAINQSKVKRFGKYFGTIDFKINSISQQMLETKKQHTKAGDLIVAGKEYSCSLEDLDIIIEKCQEGNLKLDNKEFNFTTAELERISETCQSAKEVFFKKYRLAL